MARAAHDSDPLWLAERLYEVGAIQFGEFTVGRTLNSPVYVNPRLLIGDPAMLRRVAQLILREVSFRQARLRPSCSPFDLVAGVPYGGLHLATAFSLLTDVPMVAVHLDDGKDIEGSFEPGQTVLLMDDLITTGGSLEAAAQRLREAGLQVKDAVVLVDRQSGGRERLARLGINLIPILQLEVALNYLMSDGRIEADWFERCARYFEESRRRVQAQLD